MRNRAQVQAAARSPREAREVRALRAEMARQLQSDKVLFGATVVLVLFGAIMVFSASAVMASERYGSSYYFLVRQISWVGLGLAAMVVMMNFDYRQIGRAHV